MLNKCAFIGNLGRDPEVRTLTDGKKVANLSIGVSERWKSKDGEKKERTEWVRAVLWGPLAEIAEKYLKKGSKVYICGSMQTRKWTDKDGADKYTTEIVLQGFNSEMLMLDGKPAGGNDGGWEADEPPSPRSARPGEPKKAADFDDSEIPF